MSSELPSNDFASVASGNTDTSVFVLLIIVVRFEHPMSYVRCSIIRVTVWGMINEQNCGIGGCI